MKTPYQRYSMWNVGYSYNPRNRNNSVSPTPVTGILAINLTLQFPLTQSGWKRLEENIKFHHPQHELIKMLSATPIIEDV
jgi:hypothetical protein